MGYQTGKAGQDKTDSRICERAAQTRHDSPEGIDPIETFLKIHTPTVDVPRHPTHHGRLTQDFQTTIPSLIDVIVLCHADVLEIEGPLLTMECKGLERLQICTREGYKGRVIHCARRCTSSFPR